MFHFFVSEEITQLPLFPKSYLTGIKDGKTEREKKLCPAIRDTKNRVEKVKSFFFFFFSVHSYIKSSATFT